MLNCLLHLFQRWVATSDLIGKGDFATLKKRLEHGLNPNRQSMPCTYLEYALSHLVSNPGFNAPVNRDRMLPVVCLLLAHGAKLDFSNRTTINRLLDPPAYHKDLVNLAIAYGAQFQHYAGSTPASLDAKQECLQGRGRIPRLRDEAQLLIQNGQCAAAIVKYEEAKSLAEHYHHEACSQNPAVDAEMINAYQALIDRINEAIQLHACQPVLR